MVLVQNPQSSQSQSQSRPQTTLSHSCVECGRIVERYNNEYELCQDCWLEPFTHHRAIHADAPIDPTPCPFAAGSSEKIEWMSNRLARGYSIFSPLDPTYEQFRAGIIQPSDEKKEVYSLPTLRVRGVQTHRVFHKDYIEITYRARPEIDGERHNLGEFPTYSQAAAVARRWWIDRLGLFWELGGKMWWYKRPEKPRDVKKKDAKKKCEPCAYHARLRNMILAKNRQMPANDGGLFSEFISASTHSNA